MKARRFSSMAAALLALAVSALSQDRPTLGILDARFVGHADDAVLRDLFTAAVRGKVVKLVADSVDVIEGSKLDRLIQVNASSCSNASCLAQFAKKAGLDYLLETKLTFHKGKWTASLKLASARSENLLDEEQGTYASDDSVQTGLPVLASQVVKPLTRNGNASGPAEPAVAEDVPLAPPAAGATKVIVKFGSVPPEASVTLDGKILCQTPKEKAVLQGEHWIEMGKDGYRSKREKVTVNRNGQELSWSLVPIQTRLSLDAVDDRTGNDLIADVYVDGTKVGQTPYNGLVAVGAQKIEVSPEGFERQTVSVSLEEGKTASATAHFKNQLRDSRDGQPYRTVTIGNQTWMAQNLNYATGNSWCYDNSSSNCAKYGRLYDWETAKAACPEGWHLPSDGEWQVLAKDDDQGDKSSGKPLKSRSWDGTDAYGFNVLPSGNRNNDGSLHDVGSYAYFWSSSEVGAQNAWRRRLHSGLDALDRGYDNKPNGFSVRCLKD